MKGTKVRVAAQVDSLTHSTPFIPTSILQVHETLRLDRSGQETSDSSTEAKLVDTANVEVENSVLK